MTDMFSIKRGVIVGQYFERVCVEIGCSLFFTSSFSVIVLAFISSTSVTTFPDPDSSEKQKKIMRGGRQFLQPISL